MFASTNYFDARKVISLEIWGRALHLVWPLTIETALGFLVARKPPHHVKVGAPSRGKKCGSPTRAGIANPRNPAIGTRVLHAAGVGPLRPSPPASLGP